MAEKGPNPNGPVTSPEADKFFLEGCNIGYINMGCQAAGGTRKDSNTTEHDATTPNENDLPSHQYESVRDWQRFQGVKMEISVACRGLLDADVFSLSDPIAVMYTKDLRTSKWKEFGRTETIDNTLNPDFEKKFVIDYQFDQKQDLKFQIYDIDSKSPDLRDHDFLGSYICTLGQIVGSRDRRCIGDLSITPTKIKGKIIVSVEELESSEDMIHMKWEGKGLDKKDFFGKSDPFIVFSRCNEDGCFTVCHKTEVIKRTLNPTWKKISIPSRTFCNGDPERTIKVEVYDWNRSGRHEMIGEFKTSLRRLTRGTCQENVYQCINGAMRGNTRYRDSGKLILQEFCIDKNPTFLEYIGGSMIMSFVVGIDFTSSNGNSDLPDSLHYMNSSQPNQYSVAIKATGEILQHYGKADKKFPVYGFGAKLPPHGQISHLFPINFNQRDPDCDGIDGILEAYKICVKKIQLASPTNFSPIIRKVAEMASKVSDGSNYYVLLMITDGVISDMDAAKEAIVNAAKLPMSIIIVGVGDRDFQAMKELDGDEVRLSHRGVEAERDIVQFVEMRNHIGGAENQVVRQLHLNRDLLEEIPRQLVEYMRSRKIQPSRYVD